MSLTVIPLVTLLTFITPVRPSVRPVHREPPISFPVRLSYTSLPHDPIIASRDITLSDANPWEPFVATWYSMGSITRDGAHVRDAYTVAVDPSVIPLGSHIIVKFADGSTHEYVADDTGGAIIGNRIDIYDSDTTQCLEYGVQNVWVRIIH